MGADWAESQVQDALRRENTALRTTVENLVAAISLALEIDRKGFAMPTRDLARVAGEAMDACSRLGFRP